MFKIFKKKETQCEESEISSYEKRFKEIEDSFCFDEKVIQSYGKVTVNDIDLRNIVRSWVELFYESGKTGPGSYHFAGFRIVESYNSKIIFLAHKAIMTQAYERGLEGFNISNSRCYPKMEDAIPYVKYLEDYLVGKAEKLKKEKYEKNRKVVMDAINQRKC